MCRRKTVGVCVPASSVLCTGPPWFHVWETSEVTARNVLLACIRTCLHGITVETGEGERRVSTKVTHQWVGMALVVGRGKSRVHYSADSNMHVPSGDGNGNVMVVVVAAVATRN